jgi:hypothetical protein
MKRYLKIVESYIWAESDQEAIEQAKKQAQEDNQLFDNGTRVNEVYLAEYATYNVKQIYPNKDENRI